MVGPQSADAVILREFGKATPEVLRALQRMLADMPAESFSFFRQVGSFSRSLFGYSELVGDAEHALYLLTGFLSTEYEKHQAAAKAPFGISFSAILVDRLLEVEARLAPTDRTGYVAYGLSVRRIGVDRYRLSNG